MPLLTFFPACPWADVPVKLSVVVISNQGSLWLGALTCGPGLPRWWLLTQLHSAACLPGSVTERPLRGRHVGLGLHVPRPACALESPWSH